MAGQVTRGDHGMVVDGFALFANPLMLQVETLTGTTVMSNAYPSLLKLDPGGASRDITLDPVATSAGMFRWFVNAADAAENLVLKNVGGSTIATINQNEEGIVFCDGTSWILFRVATIALS